MGFAVAAVVVPFDELDESSFPRTRSQTTKPAARAIATTAPMRTLDRRAQPVSGASLTLGRIGRPSADATGCVPRSVEPAATPARDEATIRRPGRLAQLGEH